MNLNFTPNALSDLQQIHDYIAQHNPRAADNVISRIRQTILMFETYPLIGREGLVDGTREFVAVGLPYVVVYQIASETELDILNIIHGRQKWPPKS